MSVKDCGFAIVFPSEISSWACATCGSACWNSEQHCWVRGNYRHGTATAVTGTSGKRQGNTTSMTPVPESPPSSTTKGQNVSENTRGVDSCQQCPEIDQQMEVETKKIHSTNPQTAQMESSQSAINRTEKRDSTRQRRQVQPYCQCIAFELESRKAKQRCRLSLTDGCFDAQETYMAKACDRGSD